MKKSRLGTGFVLLMMILFSTSCGSKVSQTLSKALVQTDGYDFRKARWGFTREMVTVAEQGQRLFIRKGNVLMFNHKIGGIPCKIIYCFKDNRLRAAGYITLTPAKRAHAIVEYCVEENGSPTQVLNDGMLWFKEKSLVYVNAYVSHTRSTPSSYTFSGGILSHLLSPQEDQGTIKMWDGIWAHIDRRFYEELHYERFPLDELSFYEKHLFGVLKRQHIYTFYMGQTKTSIHGNAVR